VEKEAQGRAESARAAAATAHKQTAEGETHARARVYEGFAKACAQREEAGRGLQPSRQVAPASSSAAEKHARAKAAIQRRLDQLDQAAMQAKAARARADDTRDGLSESRGIATAAVAAAAQPQRRLTTPQGEAEGSKCTSEIPGLAASDVPGLAASDVHDLAASDVHDLAASDVPDLAASASYEPEPRTARDSAAQEPAGSGSAACETTRSESCAARDSAAHEPAGPHPAAHEPAGPGPVPHESAACEPGSQHSCEGEGAQQEDGTAGEIDGQAEEIRAAKWQARTQAVLQQRLGQLEQSDMEEAAKQRLRRMLWQQLQRQQQQQQEQQQQQRRQRQQEQQDLQRQQQQQQQQQQQPLQSTMRLMLSVCKSMQHNSQQQQQQQQQQIQQQHPEIRQHLEQAQGSQGSSLSRALASDRALKEEQDAEFSASLAMDQQRSEQARAEEVAKEHALQRWERRCVCVSGMVGGFFKSEEMRL